MMATLLAADIGGTTTRLGIFELDSFSNIPIVSSQYANSDFASIEDVIDHFLKSMGLKPDHGCLGIAGVVGNGEANMTNLDWQVGVNSLQKRFKLNQVLLVNDMVALAAIVPYLKQDDIIELHQATQQSFQPVAIIAPGTGLGEGYLLWQGGQPMACGSEGGHAGFAPQNNVELELLQWMMDRYPGPICVEQVCAGPAIPRLFAFLRENQREEPVGWVLDEMQQTGDYTQAIVRGAVAEKKGCKLCLRTISLFLSLLGSEAANQALKIGAVGGVYIGGGIVPRLLGKTPFRPLVNAFRKQGEMVSMLEKIPVFAIRENNVQLSGAAVYFKSQMGPTY